MDFGLAIPQMMTTWTEIKATAIAAEQRGFDSLWLTDHLATAQPELGVWEAWTTLSGLASVTSRIGLGLHVSPVLHAPAVAAKMATSLDLVSNGRLRLILDATDRTEEWAVFTSGQTLPSRHADAVVDFLRILGGMLDPSGGPFTYSGGEYSVDDVWNFPPPARRIPVGLGTDDVAVFEGAGPGTSEWFCPHSALGSYETLSRAISSVTRPGGVIRRSVPVVYAPGQQPVPDYLATPGFDLCGSTNAIVDATRRLVKLGISEIHGAPLDLRSVHEFGDLLPTLREALP